MIMLDMVDYYVGTILILAMAAMEIMAIAWIYGTNKITRDFNFMLNMQLSVYWRFCSRWLDDPSQMIYLSLHILLDVSCYWQVSSVNIEK